MVNVSFISGLVAGLRVPATALRPARIETRINPAILKSSYRPARDDYDNLKKDFGKAIHLASEESSRRPMP